MTPQALSGATTAPTPPILNTPGASSAPLRPAYAVSPAASPSQHTSPGSPRHHQTGPIDADASLRSHGGDLRRTLDVIVNERNGLQAQNTQLWKLIDKQRAQCAHLAADNDRLRADRERANSRLVAAGLEPISSGNRRGMPHSQSTVTVSSVTASSSEQQHRRASEFDKEPATNTTSTITQVIAPRKESIPTEQQEPQPPSALAPSALPPPDDSNPAAGSTLIPSPMPERRLRHESRIQFPPEVASFMALAEKEPQNLQVAPANSNNAAAEASSYNSSPGDSLRASPVTETPEEVVKDPMSPRLSQDTVTSGRPSTSPVVGNDPRPSIDSGAVAPAVTPPPPGDHTYLTPALLPHARLSIPHTTVIPNEHGRDVMCFIVAVNVRPPNAHQLSWTVGKTFSAFMDLDIRSQERSGKQRKEWKRMVSPLPEGRTWKDFAPGKIDQRKGSLEQYLQSLLVAPISDQADLVHFLSTDVVQPKSNRNRKEGYLSKKGQGGFRSWKTRYFVLDGPVMKYYESRGGPALGQISLAGAQIGRQPGALDHPDDKNSRYAFLIIEAPRKDSSQNKHVLTAGSDAERDSWIEMLQRQVGPKTVVTQATPPSSQAQPNVAPNSAQRATPDMGHQRRRSAVRKSSKDVVVTSAQPMSQLTDANAKFISGAPLPSVINLMESQRQHFGAGNSAGPSGTNAPQGHPLGQVASTPAATSTTHMTSTTDLLAPHESPQMSSKPTKRSSAMPGRQSFSPAYLKQLANDGVSPTPGYDRDRDRKAKSGRFWGFGKIAEKPAARPVFGVPLTDSLAIAQVAGLPAIVFRCIEYLEAKHADQEEGIYRLSGSSAVIKGLKERFNHEGDVNLLALDEHWDPHAIAGLLKSYLRELPTPLLTRELHSRFLAVFDLVGPSAHVAELSRLVAELPPANYALLRAFTAHLILIVRNSAVNKMTLHNIGIVFSPTLGIPAGIFYELVSRFGAIFDDEGVDDLNMDDPTLVGGPAAAVDGRQSTSPGSSGGQEDGAAPAPAAAPPAKSKRNSRLYHAGGADAMLGLGGRTLDTSAEDSNSELSIDDIGSEPTLSTQSSDNNLSIPTHSTPSSGGRREPYNNSNAASAAAAHSDDVEALMTHNGQPAGPGA